ncbi:APC family permease [Actinomadura spongiicola]|uniref:APC family permease n=1 Tax=Actinomadura spongiicola TaxID=2303421 RepID=UPI0011C0EC9D|nr:APC family permease [Actinomadura spongiicola]
MDKTTIEPTPGERETGDAPVELRKTLTITRGIAVSISMIVGSGLLVLPGLAYASVGPSAVFAWGAAALVVLPLLLVFARLGARFPNAGGVIGFARAAFGRTGAAATAYLLLGATAFGGAAMAITGGNYVAVLIGVPDASIPAAFGFLVVVAVLNAMGSHLAGGLQTAVTALLVLLIAVVASVPFLTPGFEPPGTVAAPPSWLDLVPVVGLVFFAFTGWELVASTTEEYHRPKRDLPIVVGTAFVVIVVLYLGIATAVQMSLDRSDPMVKRAPVAAVLENALGSAAGSAAAALGTLIVFATLMGGTWATSRIVFATAREGLLPARLTRLNAKNGAPTGAIVVSVLMFGSVVAGRATDLFSLDEVFQLSAVNFIIGYVMSTLAYGRLFRHWRSLLLAVLAAAPTVWMLTGFGWILLFPAALLVVGFAVHRTTRPPLAPLVEGAS